MGDIKERVYNDLIHRIVIQDLEPGERLSDKDIMEEYGIGKTPLREVMLLLQVDGLIRRFPRSGTIVSPIDFMELRDATEIRMVLEELVAKLAIQHITPSKIAEMEKLTDTLYESSLKGVHAQFITTESKLHNKLYATTRNEKLIKILAEQQLIFSRLWYTFERSQGDLQSQVDDWRKMCAALRKGDLVKLSEVNMDHFQTFYKRLKTIF